MATQRQHFFDIIKGIAIFMVVMGHVSYMCMERIEPSIVWHLIATIHMPLFFFVSGWFTFKTVDGKIEMPNLVRRFVQLIVPYLALTPLMAMCSKHLGIDVIVRPSIANAFIHTAQWIYWFTPTLFAIIVITCAIIPIINRLKSAVSQTIAAIAICIVCLGVLKVAYTPICALLNLSGIATYLPVFVIGGLCRMHSDAFFGWCRNSKIYTTALVVLCISLFLFTYGTYNLNIRATYIAPLRSVMHLSLAIVAIAWTKPWSEQVFANETNSTGVSANVARFFRLIGRKSLPIYLLHYFFLFPMGFMVPVLENMNLDVVPFVVVCAVTATVIIVTVLCIIAVIERSTLFSILLLGSGMPKRNKKQP